MALKQLTLDFPDELVERPKAEHAWELLDKNRAGSLTPDEQAELEGMSRRNHLFALIKTQAHQHLRASA